MNFTADQLYELLPAIVRVRDAERGGPLRALLGVVAEQGRFVQQDLARLYDNLFIETCDEWVVPYLGDLLGVRGLNDPGSAGFSQRARVANTLAYRRRKGTATMLEQLARDVTGWPARAVEFFELLETTQWLNHRRLHNVRTPDLRDTNALELLDTAFDRAAHTADVRRIARDRGRFNIPNVGLFLWRLESYFLDGVSAAPAAAAADGRFLFSPVRTFLTPPASPPLFNRLPETEDDITHLAEEINVPAELRRRPLYDELEARRQALTDGRTPQAVYFGDHPTLTVAVRLKKTDPLTPIPADEIAVCQLVEPPTPVPEVWLRPDKTREYQPSEGGPKKKRKIRVAVDPVLGRLAFPAGVLPFEVIVGAAHGFPGDVGGGPYDRRSSVNEFPLDKTGWQVGVSQAEPDPPKNIFATIGEAVEEWNKTPAGTTGIIALLDNRTYEEDLTGAKKIKLDAGDRLLLVCADWPLVPKPDGNPGEMVRRDGRLVPARRRAHLFGDLHAVGDAPPASENPGALWIDGLLIEGGVEILKSGNANLGQLRLAHCTVVPGAVGITVAGGNERLSVELVRCVSGAVALADTVPALRIVESIIDAPGAVAVAAASAEIQASTIAGRTKVNVLEAGNSIFTGPVVCARQQQGCLRFSFVPTGSSTPRRYRCQPDLKLSETDVSAEQARILAWLVPDFTAEELSHPAYYQLSRSCPEELRRGADDRAEMGVWRFLRQPQRETNLRASLDEYLRVGLEAGLIFAT